MYVGKTSVPVTIQQESLIIDQMGQMFEECQQESVSEQAVRRPDVGIQLKNVNARQLKLILEFMACDEADRSKVQLPEDVPSLVTLLGLADYFMLEAL